MTQRILYENGRVFSADAARPWATSLIVEEGRILGVGSAGDLAAFVLPDTRRVDLGGRWGDGNKQHHPIRWVRLMV